MCREARIHGLNISALPKTSIFSKGGYYNINPLFPSPSLFPTQQYNQIPVEIYPSQSPLKGNKCAVKLAAAIKEEPFPIPQKSYFVELRCYHKGTAGLLDYESFQLLGMRKKSVYKISIVKAL